MKDVLVFFSFRKHKTGYYETLFNPYLIEGPKYGLRFFQGSLKDLHIEIIDNELFVTESMTGRRLDNFDVVHFDAWTKSPQQALAASLYLKKAGIPVTNEEPEHILADTKVGELARMADNGVPLPRTFMSSNREILKSFKLKPRFEYPFIVKAANIFGGKLNYLVKDYDELQKALESDPTQMFVLQEFIPNDFDYRVLVMGGKIRLVMKRQRDADSASHVNNTSQGAAAEFVPISDLSAKMQADAVHAAALTNRKGFAGVDLIVNNITGEHFVLEVNDQPAIQVGASPEVKIPSLMQYLKELAGAIPAKDII